MQSANLFPPFDPLRQSERVKGGSARAQAFKEIILRTGATMSSPGITGSGPGKRPGEVLQAFLKLGLTSFGGPIAHLGYFRDELVVRRRWLNEAQYADLVALCQFLPGPASSQIGFALGWLRGGALGALFAWAAFTLPSALFLLLFAFSADLFGGPLGQAALHGLKLVAVAVVAQAVWGMARTLTPDPQRAGIALAAVLLVIFMPTAVGQIAAIVAGAAAGIGCCRNLAATADVGSLQIGVSRRLASALLLLFLLLLVGAPALVALSPSPMLELFNAFYRAGALVFGGGHVVLPLLESSVVGPGWVNENVFLAGYGAAQAVPGPLFSFAAYLGAAASPGSSAIIAAAVALVAIFLPGMLLLLGVLPFWDKLRRFSLARAAMAGANAAVVGILASALYQPVWTSAVHAPKDFAVALTGFMVLTVWKAPPWMVVVVTAIASVALL